MFELTKVQMLECMHACRGLPFYIHCQIPISKKILLQNVGILLEGGFIYEK